MATDTPIKPTLDHDQWKAEWYIALNNYLNNDPSRNTSQAMQYATRLMTLRYGNQPEKIYKEGEKPGNILTTIGSVITAPITVIKGGVEMAVIINAILKNGKTLIGSLTGVLALISGVPWDTIGAWFAAHPIGGISAAVITFIGWVSCIIKIGKEITGQKTV